MDPVQENTRLKNPAVKANPLSKLLFIWIIPLFQKGYGNPLKIKDLYDPLDDDRTKFLGEKLLHNWRKELERSKRKNVKPQLLYAILKSFWAPFAERSLLYAIDTWIILVAQPIFLKLLVDSYSKEDDSDSSNQYYYAAGICFATLCHSLTLHPAVFEVFRIGMQCRVACSYLIYDKILRLSKATQNQTTVGHIVNLLSNDVNKFDTNINFIPFAILAPGQIAILMYFLWKEIGISCLSGFGLMFLIFPLNYYIGKYSAIIRRNIAIKTDERSKMMNEIIVGISVIKMYAWEKPFSTIIHGIRKLEVAELKKRGILRGCQAALVDAVPKMVAFSTFLTYVLLDNEMRAGTVFFTLSCFTILVKTTIHFGPQAVASMGELYVSIERIQAFLMLEEHGVINFNEKFSLNDDLSNGNQVTRLSTGYMKPEACIVMEKVSAQWTKEKITLKNLNINASSNGLYLIVGPVGSGKSSILHLLLNELPKGTGKMIINGKMSYASQEPWIFAGTLRQNVLFGLPYLKNKYDQVITACCLLSDLNQLPYGDMTHVGERGVALSGGQKARVNLARALYRDADIYLLDDPLSAVDARVSRQLMKTCMMKLLKNKICLLVTHQLQYLPQADKIFVLNQGEIIAQGSYEDMMRNEIDFVALVENTEEFGEKRKASVDTENNNDIKSLTKNGETEAKRNDEKMTTGSVTGTTYWEYFRSARSNIGLVLLAIFFMGTQLAISSSDYWLSFWTNAEEDRLENNCCNNNQNKSECNEKSCNEADNFKGEEYYLSIYSALVLSLIFLSLARSIYFFLYCTKIGVNLHDWMFSSFSRAPIKFFDENPSGRIMNRFTKDCGVLDELLGTAMSDTVVILLRMIGVIVIVTISNYYLSIPSFLMLIALYLMRKIFVTTARDLKRIEAITRSPLFTHVSASIQGLSTIRALKCERILMAQFEAHQDLHTSAWYLFMAGNRWFGLWLEIISCIFLVVVSSSFLLFDSNNGSGALGLALSSVLTMLGAFQWGMRQSAETENFMTSTERALEYAKLSPEAPLESSPQFKPPKHWPNNGEIHFQNVFLAYDEKPVLKNLCFTIRPREKIGIVGRTGAGKSSIIAALFRMTEPTGDIFIDGVKITDIGLHELRSSISIIPQDPILFSGTVRYNLDPFGNFQDDQLWTVIREVELRGEIKTLDDEVSGGGSNFSVGQRQLVCLARAILRKNSIIVMDEVTANVDPRTDLLIQNTIRSKFKECTIITIAHRLNTVMDCDRILVLENGYVEEFNHPYILLQNESGVLSKMVAQTGTAFSKVLRSVAQETYSGRKASFSEGSFVVSGEFQDKQSQPSQAKPS